MHTEFTTNGLWFSGICLGKMLVGLIINFGEQKVEIKRKARDFDEDLQDEF